MVDDGLMADCDATPPPVVILVRPQMGENIGSAARAMMNCGLADLRLVNPRDGWPNPAAMPTAAGGASIIENARVFDTIAAASDDITLIFAATARRRDMLTKTANPRVAAEIAVAHMRTKTGASGMPQKVAMMFGPEASGLDNDEVVRADYLVTAALNPTYPSLNLAQAVLLMAWEWRMATLSETFADAISMQAEHLPAPAGERDVFLTRLEAELDKGGFFTAPKMAKTVKRNLRAVFSRAAPTSQEISTLHGVIQALTRRR